MKKIEIFTLTIIAIVAGFSMTCNAQTADYKNVMPVFMTNTVSEPETFKPTIRAYNLSELIRSQDVIECFSHYYDVKPEVLRGYTDDTGKYHTAMLPEYQMLFENELREKGYKPGYITEHIFFTVPFDQDGNMMDINRLQKHLKGTRTKVSQQKEYRIIGNHPEKTVFHYEPIGEE